LAAFIGEVDQIPPNYSAIKVDGERAYDLAREGVEFELKTRKVNIHALRVSERPTPTTSSWRWNAARAPMSAPWSATWPRRSGTCGHVDQLRRTRVGRFTEDSAIGAGNP
jgi:tRNA pseudouridine55 synthase